MASEYLKWKFRDEKPDETAVLTPEEKRRNWWHYHKWYIIVGAILLFGTVSLVWSIFGIGQAQPDYQIAYVGASPLPKDTAAALERAVAALGEDLNGDGKTIVRVEQYITSTDDPNRAASAEVTIVGDLVACKSYFFLLDDPDWFQQRYHALSFLDGSLPPDDDISAEGKCLAWSGCPVLTGLELGEYTETLLGATAKGTNQDMLSRLYFARRGFWTEETENLPHLADYAALWDKLTAGAA